jgi:hypothetical protein
MVLPLTRLGPGAFGIPQPNATGDQQSYQRPPQITWSLFNLDTFEEFIAQFPPDEVAQNVGAQYAEAWALNREDPIMQWVRGTLETWNFTALLHAIDSTDFIDSRINTLISSVKRDSTAQRPPVYIWTWGIFQVQCTIESVGDVKYKLRPDETPRSAMFSIRLRKYTPHDIVVTDPNQPFSDTYYYVVKNGQTFESLAELRYKQPLWGEYLRRENPGKPYPLAGQTIAMPEEDRLFDLEVEPESPPLERTEEALVVRQDLFALRGRNKFSHVL